MTTTNADINDARPTVMEHFVGQQSVVDRIRVALEASWRDGTRLPHMLFTGQPGLGKTELASLLARETGSRIIEQLAQNLGSPAAMQGFLLEGEDRDILFIDEVHELPSFAQTTLYRALEEGRLFLPHSSLKPGPPKVIQLSSFTLIASTTDQYALLSPLIARFKIVARLSKYSPADLSVMLTHRCNKLRWSTEPGVIDAIAQRGRGTPRRVLTLLESVYRYSRADGADLMTWDHFRATCCLEGIDHAGLNESEQQYLRLLESKDGPVRLNVIAARLGIPPRTVQQVLEADLIEEGLVDKLSNGERQITSKAIRHLSLEDTNESDHGPGVRELATDGDSNDRC